MSLAVATRGAAIVGQLVDVDGGLPAAVQQFAALPASANTRRSYRTACDAFLAFLAMRHGGQLPERFEAREVAAWRDRLVDSGAAPATVAQRLTAVRRLADHAGLDDAIQRVRATSVQQLPSPALTGEELSRLLAMPDLRSRRGRRDLAVLHLLASCGLRRAEASVLTLDDVREVARAPDPRARAAVAARPADRTGMEILVRHSKRGRSRTVPLNRPALQALQGWFDVRSRLDPPPSSRWLLLAFPRGREASQLSGTQIARLVERYAEHAAVAQDRRTPHALRHTFCTHLGQRGVGIDVIQSLAGHADIRTTARYLHVDQERREQAVDALTQTPHPLGR